MTISKNKTSDKFEDRIYNNLIKRVIETLLKNKNKK